MFEMMGAIGRGQAPTRRDVSLNAVYPLAWMFVGYIFAINLFVGVGAYAAPEQPCQTTLSRR
jgi:hypothetical protein